MTHGRDGSARLLAALEAARAESSKRVFLARADELQRALENDLRETFGRPAWARLVALRLTNLVVARFHFHHRHSRLASRPIELMLDPVNNCHLSCPGCLHTANPGFAGAFDWPGGRIADEHYDRLLAEYGPLAWGMVFYNWGEPLLHKGTPGLVRRAKRLLLQTFISTNLSVRFDVDDLVASGLNFLFLSIDGASQETYSKFRRGGDFALCMENIRLVVEAKRRLGSPTPFINWRFLTFEHNVHEVDRAAALAEAAGVDEFAVATPFDVSWDDPDVRVARSPRAGTYLLRPDASFRGPLDDWRSAVLDESAIDHAFECSWLDRLGAGALDEEPSRPTTATCHWLYQNLTLDARARLFPCCMAPEFGRHKVYGAFDADPVGAFNAQDFELSRLAFADRELFDARRASAPAGEAPPYCAVCTEKPELTYTLERDVRRDLEIALAGRLLSPAAIEALTSWPASR